ncbi:hypothetical protein GCM10009840_02290 [Pseudolysinimonas kribbensis]
MSSATPVATKHASVINGPLPSDGSSGIHGRQGRGFGEGLAHRDAARYPLAGDTRRRTMDA